MTRPRETAPRCGLAKDRQSHAGLRLLLPFQVWYNGSGTDILKGTNAMEISIELPDIEPFATMDTAYLKELLAATLYHVGKISEKEACALIGKTRREFEEMLPKYGFSVLSPAEENIAVELNA